MKFSVAATASFLGWAGLTFAQVKTPQPDLKVQTVWDNIWGVVQVVFLPGGKVLTVHKPGELHVYESILAKSQDYTTILDIKDEVYSWWDHGMLSAALHPNFPEKPYLYVAYSAEYPGAPWNDQCVPDPKKEAMSDPPDTRPYCKSMAKLVRLKVDEDFTTAEVETELFHDWCTSTYTHHVGTINFLADGSMFYGAGDGSHFQGLDHGQPQDECTDPKGPKDQGVFTAQKPEYLRGKFLKIKPESILKDGYLEKDVDYVMVSRGSRNPFRSTVEPKTGDVYIGDVGSSVWEEINYLPNPLNYDGGELTNFGWPCVEGPDSVSDIYQNWLRTENLLPVCADIYNGEFQKPVFAYRYGAVDPDFPDECAEADASVSGITFYTGNKLPAKYQNKLFFVDYSKKCGFWFDQGADGKPDFSHAHAFLTTAGAGSGGVTDVKTGPDGYLYVADYAGGKLYRFGDFNDKDMDAMLTKAATEDDNKDNGIWIESTPNPYEWVYGDVVQYKLNSPVALDEKKIKWRATNGHCVKNPCTGTNDCHMHEVSLTQDSTVGLDGTLRPSPHPMESYIKLTATYELPDGTEGKAELNTHALAYNYKIISDPPGLPIIIEEFTCLASPCISSQMAKTNPGFAAQTAQVWGDKVYAFDSWTATNAATGKSKTVKAQIFEETADADYVVKANYKPVKVVNDDALGVPAGIEVEGDYMRTSVKWTAPPAGGPDFVIITVKNAAGQLVRDHMTTAAKANVVLPLPLGAAPYNLEMSYYNSADQKRGPRSEPVAFETKAELTKGKAACLAGTQFTEQLKKSAKDGDKYQMAILGTYPTTLHTGQKVKLTFDVVSETATSLMVNVLSKQDFKWVGGKTISIPAKTNKFMTVEFPLSEAIKNKEEYFIDALLVKDPKDYKTAFVEDTANKIMGVGKPAPPAAAPAAPVAPATPPAADNADAQPAAPAAVAAADPAPAKP